MTLFPVKETPRFYSSASDTSCRDQLYRVQSPKTLNLERADTNITRGMLAARQFDYFAEEHSYER